MGRRPKSNAKTHGYSHSFKCSYFADVLGSVFYGIVTSRAVFHRLLSHPLNLLLFFPRQNSETVTNCARILQIQIRFVENMNETHALPCPTFQSSAPIMQAISECFTFVFDFPLYANWAWRLGPIC